MKYKVKLTKSAETDILSSFEWGIRNWGVDGAKTWAIKLRRVIKQRLSQSPLSYPLAPDRDLSQPDVRHLLHGRYRVLFEIDGSTVRVLYVRGPYVETIPEGNQE